MGTTRSLGNIAHRAWNYFLSIIKFKKMEKTSIPLTHYMFILHVSFYFTHIKRLPVWKA